MFSFYLLFSCLKFAFMVSFLSGNFDSLSQQENQSIIITMAGYTVVTKRWWLKSTKYSAKGAKLVTKRWWLKSTKYSAKGAKLVTLVEFVSTELCHNVGSTNKMLIFLLKNRCYQC